MDAEPAAGPAVSISPGHGLVGWGCPARWGARLPSGPDEPIGEQPDETVNPTTPVRPGSRVAGVTQNRSGAADRDGEAHRIRAPAVMVDRSGPESHRCGYGA